MTYILSQFDIKDCVKNIAFALLELHFLTRWDPLAFNQFADMIYSIIYQ